MLILARLKHREEGCANVVVSFILTAYLSKGSRSAGAYSSCHLEWDRVPPGEELDKM